MSIRPKSLAATLALLAASANVNAAIEVEAKPSRPFGYTIGDVVVQTLHLQVPAGQSLIESSLPREGRAGAWVERRAVDVKPEAGGWRIALTYQFINAPLELRTVALPPVKLQMRDGERTLDETLAESPVTLAPLTPAVVLARAGLEEMRPDVAPPLIDTTPQVRRLSAYALAAGLIGFAWAAWHFGFGLAGRRARPFARAERDLRRLLDRDAQPIARRDALRMIHRALDASAGSTVFAESLDAFFARRPRFAPAHDDVKRFFAASRAEFFGQAQDAPDFSSADLLALARQLKALERESG
ncbi:MAG: nonribosomal peptide synthetase MxaA [Candidatus Methylophosphatis roskildensis]